MNRETTTGGPVDEARTAHARVARWLLESRRAVAEEFGPQPRCAGATADADREARQRLRRLSCLSLALDALLERVDELEQAAGGSVELARLLAAPCEVWFTLGTGEPGHAETLTVPQIVGAARGHRDAITGRCAARRSAVDDLAAELGRLRTGVEELLGTAGPDDGGLAARLAELERLAADDPLGGVGAGPWRETLVRTADEIAARRRARAVAAEQARVDRVERLRTAVRRLRRLAAEATVEGLGDGSDPLAGLTAGRLLDEADRDGREPPSAEELDRAVLAVDAARRGLRRRCHAELGGRLAAYRQRAADRGHAEHPELDRHYRAARETLRPDHFAVTAASRAVRAYQQAVNEVSR